MMIFRILMTSVSVFIALLIVRIALVVLDVDPPSWVDITFDYAFVLSAVVFGLMLAGCLLVFAWGPL